MECAKRKAVEVESEEQPHRFFIVPRSRIEKVEDRIDGRWASVLFIQRKHVMVG
jgi:hypothetical protein